MAAAVVTPSGGDLSASSMKLNAEEIGSAKSSEISKARENENKEVMRIVGCTVCGYLLLASFLCAVLPSSAGIADTPEYAFDAQMHLYGFVGFLTFGSLQWIGAALSADEGLARASLIPSGMAVIGSACYFLHGFDLAPAWRTPSQPEIITYPVRNLSWMGTTSLIVYAIWQSTGLPTRNLVVSELMILLKFSLASLAQLQSSPQLLYGVFSIYAVAFTASVVNKWRMLDITIAICSDNQRAQGSIRLLRILTVGVWLAFPANYLLQHLRVIPPTTMEVVFVVLDIAAKCILAGASAQGAIRTLSDRRHSKLQEMSVSMVDQLREHDKRKDRFFAAMTHELRTPLNGIIGLTDSLLYSESAMSAKCRSALTTVRDTGKRFHKLINNILDNASLEEKKLNLVLQPVSVHQLVEEVSMLITPILNPNVKLVLALPQELPLVQGDFNRLVQVVFNLLGNSAKFTEKGTITVRARVEDEHIMVHFMDTGIGIPSDKLELVFHPFEQVDMSKSRSHGGTGLGLSLAKRLVESHTGKLTVESEIGEGTCFTMSLPIDSSKTSQAAPTPVLSPGPTVGGPCRPSEGRCPPTKDGLAELPVPDLQEASAAPAAPKRSLDRAKAPAKRSASIVSSTNSAGDKTAERNNLLQWISDRSSEMNSMTESGDKPIEILSVDDDPVNQAVITDLLTSKAMQVTVAMDAREALNLLEDRFQEDGLESFPKLILMDQMMPNMTGLEATEIIRERYPLSAVPVVMVSANNDEASICQALENGCNDYITKPFQRTELLARVGLQIRMLHFYLREVQGQQNEMHMVDLLPPSIIRRLKAGETNIADSVRSATTMHAELTNLRELAASCKPGVLVGMLNKLTVTLEAIAKKHSVFRRPIDGGHFRVLSGIDGATSKDHAMRVLKVAAEFMEACSSLTINGKTVKVKAGVSSGPGLGGITGNHPPQYVVVGDTTAQAILMAREALPGCVFVSDSTHSLLSPEALAEVYFCDLGDRPVGRGVEQTWMLQVADWEAGLKQAFRAPNLRSLDRRRSISQRMSVADARQHLPGVVQVDNFARLSTEEFSDHLPTEVSAQQLLQSSADWQPEDDHLPKAARGKSLDDLYQLVASLVAQTSGTKPAPAETAGLSEVVDSMMTMAQAMDEVCENLSGVREQLDEQQERERAGRAALVEMVGSVSDKVDDVALTCEAIDTHLAEKAEEEELGTTVASVSYGSPFAATGSEGPRGEALELMEELRDSIDRLEACTGDLGLVQEEQEAKLAAEEETISRVLEAVAQLGPSVELCHQSISQHREDTEELRKSVLSAIESIEISTPSGSEANHPCLLRDSGSTSPHTPTAQQPEAPQHGASPRGSLSDSDREGEAPAPADPTEELVGLLERHGKQRYSKILLRSHATVPTLRGLNSSTDLKAFGIHSPSAQRLIYNAVQSEAA